MNFTKFIKKFFMFSFSMSLSSVSVKASKLGDIAPFDFSKTETGYLGKKLFDLCCKCKKPLDLNNCPQYRGNKLITFITYNGKGFARIRAHCEECIVKHLTSYVKNAVKTCHDKGYNYNDPDRIVEYLSKNPNKLPAEVNMFMDDGMPDMDSNVQCEKCKYVIAPLDGSVGLCKKIGDKYSHVDCPNYPKLSINNEENKNGNYLKVRRFINMEKIIRECIDELNPNVQKGKDDQNENPCKNLCVIF